MKIIDYLCRGHEFDKKLAASRERLYRVAYSWCHQPDVADDLVQETCAKALKRRSQLRDAAKFDGWLLRILANTWYDLLRLRKEQVEYDDVYMADEMSPEYIHSRYEAIVDMRKAIALLPIGQRQVLSLVELEQCSYSDVAEILEIPVGTVMSRLNRARKQLREILLQGQSSNTGNVTPLRRQK